MNTKNECQELKNIKYKSMLLSSDSQNTTDMGGIEKMLETESKINKKEPWNKLDKTLKIKKINEFVDNIVKCQYELEDNEIATLKSYLSRSLDLIKLSRVKDVEYVKDKGEIKNIPSLAFNPKTRTFTLKRCDKRVSTLKSLGNPATTKKNREKKKINKKDKIDSKNS
uniref:Uncharacterized protein n=1 Tax=viral metagenome TaxID=1070528 RepID=A0A6C0C012_9ZZZZ